MFAVGEINVVYGKGRIGDGDGAAHCRIKVGPSALEYLAKCVASWKHAADLPVS